MAVSIGKMGEFDAAVENWSSYLERLIYKPLLRGE